DEESFCSLACREVEIPINEARQELSSNPDSESPPEMGFHGDFFELGIQSLQYRRRQHPLLPSRSSS
ncbi:hypothetical protein PIB30_106932, partial [Stylosanthes scabra]|nr:hypothetical protein [Stylosanthes scabra]